MGEQLVNGQLGKRNFLRKPAKAGVGVTNKMHDPQHGLKMWGKQKWRTKSGKKSSVTGERYLPEAAIKALSPAEYSATTAAKRRDKKRGKQFSKQPESIVRKTRAYR